MAGSGTIASNTGKFLACAVLKFLPPSQLMVAQRFPKAIDREPQEFKNLLSFVRKGRKFNERKDHVVTSLERCLDSCLLKNL